jgi:hypothetical protein
VSPGKGAFLEGTDNPNSGKNLARASGAGLDTDDMDHAEVASSLATGRRRTGRSRLGPIFEIIDGIEFKNLSN